MTSHLTALCYRQGFGYKEWRATKRPPQMLLPLHARHLGPGPRQKAGGLLPWDTQAWRERRGLPRWLAVDAVDGPRSERRQSTTGMSGGGAQIDHCRDAPQSEMTKAPWGLLAQCQAESSIGAGTALRNAG